MNVLRRLLVPTCLFCLCPPLAAADLTKIDRTIKKEPAYETKAPKYCLLVFGPEAKTRVWLVADGKVLYVDRNGSGDLTEEGKRVPERKPLGDITEIDGQTKHTQLEVFGRPDRRGFTISVMLQGKVLQQTFESIHCNQGFLVFADKPADAPIVHFGGPLTFGLFQGSVTRPHPPLVRGRDDGRTVHIGTPGLGKGTFASISHQGLDPKFLPVGEAEFPAAKMGDKPLTSKIDFAEAEKGCTFCFYCSFSVPQAAGNGAGKLTMSFPAWKEQKIGPGIISLPIADSKRD